MQIPSTDVVMRVQNRYHLESGRLSRALEILGRDEIEKLPNGNFACKSHSPKAPSCYQVNPEFESCTCMDAKDWFEGNVLVRKGNVCKHMIAWMLLREQTREEQFARARDTAVTTHTPQVAIIVRDPIRERELLYKSTQPTRTEWVEELSPA